MDKVHSAIKSLECVDILQQVKVEEKDTEEVVHSGAGSRHVKNEEIEDQDALKNAEQDPIQDINNRSESDEEDREPASVHTGASSERKRKSSAASGDALTTLPKIRKKTKADKDKSTHSKTSFDERCTSFDERCNQLLRFKEEIGHCNVPVKYSGNPSFGKWCSTMRTAYKKIQKGMKTNRNLSQDRIERLEEIGFQWQVVDYNESFKKRCRELMAFKEEFGHCNVFYKYADNPSLGQWCSTMRKAYKIIQKGMKTNRNLSQNRIERQEKIGFQWQGIDYDEAFKKRCRKLVAFKEEFGHCNVPHKFANNSSLGYWCSSMRTTYRRMQKGLKTNSNLSQDRIERLEDTGFQWNLQECQNVARM